MGTLLDDPPRIALGPGSRQRPLTKFALIGDVHAEDERLETAIAHAHAEKCEALLCVGDVADGFGDLARTIAILEREHVRVVRGNHDRWFLNDDMRDLAPPVQRRADFPQVEAIERLWPPLLEVETVLGTLLLCHGVGDDDFATLKAHTTEHEVRWLAPWQRLVQAQRYRFMAGGHTHHAMVRTIDGITILNPGTLKRDKQPCTAIVDLEAREMRLFDLEDAREARFDRALSI